MNKENYTKTFQKTINKEPVEEGIDLTDILPCCLLPLLVTVK